jgi:hypothetical protein
MCQSRICPSLASPTSAAHHPPSNAPREGVTPRSARQRSEVILQGEHENGARTMRPFTFPGSQDFVWVVVDGLFCTPCSNGCGQTEAIILSECLTTALGRYHPNRLAGGLLDRKPGASALMNRVRKTRQVSRSKIPAWIGSARSASQLIGQHPLRHRCERWRIWCRPCSPCLLRPACATA